MKSFLATTAIALVLANGAFAESHVAADGAATDGTMTTDENMPADHNMTDMDADATMESDVEAETEMDAEAETEMDEGVVSTEGDVTTTTEGMTDSTTTSGSVDANMETDTTVTTTAPSIALDGYTTVTNMDLTSDELTGTNVYGSDDDDVGEIGDLVVGDDGSISEVIIDVGGFLGLGEKPVAIPFDQVQVLRQNEGDDLRAYVSMTEDQLKELPKYESDANMENADPALQPADSTMEPQMDTTAPAEPAMDPATDAPADSEMEPAMDEAADPAMEPADTEAEPAN